MTTHERHRRCTLKQYSPAVSSFLQVLARVKLCEALDRVALSEACKKVRLPQCLTDNLDIHHLIAPYAEAQSVFEVLAGRATEGLFLEPLKTVAAVVTVPGCSTTFVSLKRDSRTLLSP